MHVPHEKATVRKNRPLFTRPSSCYSPPTRSSIPGPWALGGPTRENAPSHSPFRLQRSPLPPLHEFKVLGVARDGTASPTIRVPSPFIPPPGRHGLRCAVPT